MNLRKLIEQLRASLTPKLTERDTARTERDQIREACVNENRDPTEDEAQAVVTATQRIDEIDAEVTAIRAQIDQYEAELRADEAADRLSRELHPGGLPAGGDGEQRAARVESVNEPRTYSRENDPRGVMFLRDVALSALGGGHPQAAQRLSQHMREETVDRAAAGSPLEDRAVGTSAFSGLVVPQYLVDMAAPYARAARPFADACRHHDLPAEGTVVDISKLTTGTSTDLQSAENAAVDETDADDTLLQISLQTNAGQQTVSRQAVERGRGIEDTLMQDLAVAYDTTLDSTLINQGTTGLSAVATAVTFTSGSPTAALLYPKLLQGIGEVEAALLDQDPNATAVVMHSRRWAWVQSQLSSTFPLIAQQSFGLNFSAGGVANDSGYGSGVRGVLPSGAPVIVDNNIATNLGAGTNQDEIYVVSLAECHLWEDPNAPMMIRTDTGPSMKTNAIDIVVYGFVAYTFSRISHARAVSGTGLVTPTF